MLLLFCSPVVIKAQADRAEKDESLFFEELAKEDALQEQYLRLTDEEDQHDYWNDQNSFEAELKKYNYHTYLSYLKVKTEAYAAHELECSAACGHGAYYFSQAEFYKQFTGDVLTTQLTSVDDRATNATLGMVQKDNKQ